MHTHCFIFHSLDEEVPEVQELKKLPELLKANPEGIFRSTYFLPKESAGTAITELERGTLSQSGPLTITHSIRRAGEMILENCVYSGVSIFLEVDGKKMPELPSRPELIKILSEEKTLVNVDGKAYRPTTEVFGFQQVYDDTVKTIERLKSLGISHEAMLILATPDEITIELHPGIFGLPEDSSLSEKYRALLYKLTDVRLIERRYAKFSDLTILLDTVDPAGKILLPGSIHPKLHRSKVCVGQSHFAYGPAAFSDYCGKKRSIDECLNEVNAWLKFLNVPFNPIEKLKEALEKVPVLSSPSPVPGTTAAAPQTGSGGFQPIKAEILDNLAVFPQSQPPLYSPFPELNKALGGGWSPRGLHFIIGPREEGKTAFLTTQACHLSLNRGLLFFSREEVFSDFVRRLLCRHHKLAMGEIIAKVSLEGSEAGLREKLKLAMKSCANGLPEELFFRGADSAINPFQADEFSELVKLLPGNFPKVICLDGYTQEDFDNNRQFFLDLREKAISQDFVVICSIHVPFFQYSRPHFIEEQDYLWLAKWQELTDSITTLSSEKLNLKKFLAISQGKVDPAVAEKLEQKLYQALETKRTKNDTFSFIRVLHSRYGVRSLILYLYQRELQRFAEGPSQGLARP